MKYDVPSRLTFLEKTISASIDRITGKQIKAKAIYLCECGNIIEAQTNKVNSGVTKSCGCLSKDYPHNAKHGLHNHPLNWIWYNIKARCYNVKNPGYEYYGAVGVEMCKEWKDDFIAFYTWAMSNGWRTGLQIDKDIKAKKIGQSPGKLYSPDMCSIVTPAENANNKTNNNIITFNGESKTLSNWASVFKIPNVRIFNRIQAGWEMEDVFNNPSRNKNGYKRKNKSK